MVGDQYSSYPKKPHRDGIEADPSAVTLSYPVSTTTEDLLRRSAMDVQRRRRKKDESIARNGEGEETYKGHENERAPRESTKDRRDSGGDELKDEKGGKTKGKRKKRKEAANNVQTQGHDQDEVDSIKQERIPDNTFDNGSVVKHEESPENLPKPQNLRTYPGNQASNGFLGEFDGDISPNEQTINEDDQNYGGQLKKGRERKKGKKKKHKKDSQSESKGHTDGEPSRKETGTRAPKENHVHIVDEKPSEVDAETLTLPGAGLGKSFEFNLDDYSANDEEEIKVRWNMRRTSERPCICCGQLCGLWILSLIVLIALGAVIGSIQFSLDVPFYNRAEINQQREDAYAATERDADFLSTFGDVSTQECVNTEPTVLTRQGELINGPEPTANCQRASSSVFRLIYITKDRTSSIWTPENLMAIKQIEDRILNTLQLSRYCYLINSTFSYTDFQTRDVAAWSQALIRSVNNEPINVACERIVSPLNFLDPLYFDIQDDSGLGYYLVGSDVVKQEYDFSQENLDNVINFWNSYTTQSYDIGAVFPDTTATVGGSITVQNLFEFVTSTDFRAGSTGMIGLTSIYSLGIPINGYTSTSDAADDQHSDIGQWLWDEFDSFLKDASFGNVEIYWADTEGGMSSAEAGLFAIQSFLFFPASVVSVLLYLIYMQDSFFVGLMGIMQLLLAFIPTLIIYRYVIGETYLGVLNIIAFYIILGIGVDDIFVFCDQYYHQHGVKKFDIRMQKTYNIAVKAMFTTSCTTFISFIANAGSLFPAVSSFGLFAAILVFVNFCAVTTFFPAVFSVYHTYVRKFWWDHPSLLFCCNKKVPGEDGEIEEEEYQGDAEFQEEEPAKNLDGEEEAIAPSEAHGESDHEGGALVSFFRDKWAPFIIRFRYIVVAIFAGILVGGIVFAAQLQPDENAPSTLPNGNNYKDQPTILLTYFARSGNPRAIDVIWVSGINPDDPINRDGTVPTNTTDYGEANYLDCATFNPTTPEAQVWTLRTCHDMFYGNVTEYHGGDTSFDIGGSNGPDSRLVITENVPMTDQRYYQQVSCIMQGFRDWTLTDTGCASLQGQGLQCLNETSARQGCTTWDVNGNSCEPFPVPADNWLPLFIAFLEDEATDPNTQQTNFDRFGEQIFVTDRVDVDPDDIIQGDFSCRTAPSDAEFPGNILNAMSNIVTLDQDIAQSFEDGIDLYDRWDAWATQMRRFAPREMIGTMQTSSGAWSFYFLNQDLIAETFSGIGLALGLGFLVLTFVGGNIVMAAFSIFNILLIVVDIFAFTVLVDFDLGVVEAVNYVVVIGMSIDYSVHMSEAYTEAEASTRHERVILMIEEMGVSVLSGALSTLLAAFWMFFAPNLFFVKFASFLFATIFLSCVYALVFFPAILAIIGPLGNTGGIYIWFKHLRHNFVKSYIQSKEFIQREIKEKMKQRQEAKAPAAEEEGPVGA